MYIALKKYNLMLQTNNASQYEMVADLVYKSVLFISEQADRINLSVESFASATIEHGNE